LEGGDWGLSVPQSLPLLNNMLCAMGANIVLELLNKILDKIKAK
jgi:hypothetical protein